MSGLTACPAAVFVPQPAREQRVRDGRRGCGGRAARGGGGARGGRARRANDPARDGRRGAVRRVSLTINRKASAGVLENGRRWRGAGSCGVQAVARAPFLAVPPSPFSLPPALRLLARFNPSRVLCPTPRTATLQSSLAAYTIQHTPYTIRHTPHTMRRTPYADSPMDVLYPRPSTYTAALHRHAPCSIVPDPRLLCICSLVCSIYRYTRGGGCIAFAVSLSTGIRSAGRRDCRLFAVRSRRPGTDMCVTRRRRLVIREYMLEHWWLCKFQRLSCPSSACRISRQAR